jgi:hypothetical protein
VLSRLKLVAAHEAGQLQFFSNHAPLADAQAFAAYLAPARKTQWVVYSKRPFAGPKAVLAYLACYTHRVAISNSRLIALDDQGVTFKWKDYRIEGRDRYKLMTLATHEFIRRFLIHSLPPRRRGCFPADSPYRYYGLSANASRAGNIARARELLAVPKPRSNAPAPAAPMPARPPSSHLQPNSCSLKKNPKQLLTRPEILFG